MKKLLLIMFLIVVSQDVTTCALVSQPTEQQVNALMQQVQFFADQGIPHEDILKIFEQSLAQDATHEDKPSFLATNKWCILLGISCLMSATIGGYLAYKLIQQDCAQNEERYNNRIAVLEEGHRVHLEHLNQLPDQRRAEHQDFMARMRALELARDNAHQNIAQ